MLYGGSPSSLVASLNAVHESPDTISAVMRKCYNSAMCNKY